MLWWLTCLVFSVIFCRSLFVLLSFYSWPLHCIACPSSISGFWLPPFGMFWPLHCMSVFDIRLLITSLVTFGHCIACPSSISGFWLPRWYLQTFLILKGYKCTNMKLLWSNIYIKKKVKHPHVSLKWQMIRQVSRDYWPYNFKNAKEIC
jgi:hypothetical protein